MLLPFLDTVFSQTKVFLLAVIFKICDHLEVVVSVFLKYLNNNNKTIKAKQFGFFHHFYFLFDFIRAKSGVNHDSK